MSSKQKIAISAIGIVLVLAIIGLTIGLVLTANTVAQTNSMTVGYTATNVQAEITAVSGKVNNTGNELTITGTNPTVIATTATSTVDGVSFAKANLTNPTDYVVYTFLVENTATGGDAITAEIVAASTGNDAAKYAVTTGYGASAEAALTAAESGSTSATTTVDAQGETYMVVLVKLVDTSVSSELQATAIITLTHASVNA